MKIDNYIIAIGLSAGGLEPLKEIIKNLDYSLNASYIIAEHHLNNTENRLQDILKTLTKIDIKKAVDDEIIKPKTIYICPANTHIIVVNNKIELYSIENQATFKPSINWLFESISKYQSKAIAIVLSGALNDGSNGILNVKLNGGIVLVQDPKTAKFPMMPQNAIDTNLCDFILSPKNIALTLNKFLKLGLSIKDDKLETLNKIFSILKTEFQINFGEYKMGTLLRRIERRMVLNKISKINNYLEFIIKNHKEKKLLFDDLLIVVTSFCRNKDSFIKLKEIFTEYILNSNEKELKIWNIGCATGEESFSLAIMISTILKENDIDKNFHIFSTDVSQKAIDIGRIASYNKQEVKSSLPECNLKYFEEKENQYVVIPEIREKVSFAIHNILEDTPLTNMDLIVCRNLLIYFKIQAQEKFFSLVNYALKDNGILFIGKSESLPEKSESLFETINTKTKIYKKNNNQSNLFPISHHISEPKKTKIISNSIIDILKENINKIFNTFIIIDNYGNILYTAGEYQKYLKIPQGEFTNNIFSFIDEELNLPLHTIISQTKSTLNSVNYKIRLNNNKIQYINLISIPLNEFRENTIGIFFIPSSSELVINNSDKNCVEIEHELIETKQKLKYTLEELSTTNEELQTSNEELQSSNEELITTNEELRAVNDSLNKTNNELNEYKSELEKKVIQKTKEILKEQKIREKIKEQYVTKLQDKLEKKMKELRKKDILLQNEYKLARMGEMLSNISHQYRQPLNRLSLNLSNLEANIDNISKKDIKNHITKSYDSIKFLSETIDDFKNLFNTNQHKHIINLKTLITNMFNFIEIHKVIHNINIKIKIDKNIKIATFTNELTHILLNLIHNAKDAIIETKPNNPFIKISTKQKDNVIIIKVKDNGGGIQNLNKLFLPYVTTKKNGIGIGLYMSKVIAKKKLNGKLFAKNNKNGATFYLRIKQNETNL